MRVRVRVIKLLLFLFFILSSLSGCYSVIEQELVQDIPKATDLVTCEGQFKSYTACMVNFHKTRCDSLKKSLDDKVLKKQMLDQANDLCDLQSFLTFCDLNNIQIHTMTIKGTRERNKQVFSHCGIQHPPGF